MSEDPGTTREDRSDASYLAQRRFCLEHASDLVASAERVLAHDNAYPNIAYHLAILAMEEIGKAGMLASRAVVGTSRDGASIEKRFDDHVFKLMWAVWSPTLSIGKIDPKAFEEARQFAQSTHARRMAGLYVDYDDNASVAPRDAVKLAHATSLLDVARVRLAMEVEGGTPVQIEQNDELEWFLATTGDDTGKQRLFSPPFIEKHHEFQGDTRAWVRWAREEFAKIAAEEKEHLQRELARQASGPGQGRPKWLMKVRLQTASHSLRQKALNYWNDRIEVVKLRAVGNKKNELLLEMTLGDNVTIEQLFDAGMAWSKLYLAMLNIGTAGFFWYELSGQAETYYESISDLDKPGMQLRIGKVQGLSREWTEGEHKESKRQRIALEEVHLANAIMCLAAFISMPDKSAEPIFGQYLKGLMLVSKTDLHLSAAREAHSAFVATVRNAMRHCGDLGAEDLGLITALHHALEPIIPDPSHRAVIFNGLDGVPPEDRALSDAVSAKRVADLYLLSVAKRLWPEFVERQKQR